MDGFSIGMRGSECLLAMKDSGTGLGTFVDLVGWGGEGRGREWISLRCGFRLYS